MMTGQCCSSLFLLFVCSSGSCFLCSSFCLLVLFLFSFFSFLSICVLASLFSGFLPFSSVSRVVFWYVPVSVLFSSFGLPFSVSWVLSYASSSLSFVFVSTVIFSWNALFLVQLLLKMETWSCYWRRSRGRAAGIQQSHLLFLSSVRSSLVFFSFSPSFLFFFLRLCSLFLFFLFSV